MRKTRVELIGRADKNWRVLASFGRAADISPLIFSHFVKGWPRCGPVLGSARTEVAEGELQHQGREAAGSRAIVVQ